MGSSVTHVPLGKRALTGAFAVALAAPLLTGALVPNSAQNKLLLTVAGGDLSAVTADVTHSGGQVLQSFPVAGALLVMMPTGIPVPSGSFAIPDQQMTFNGAMTEVSSAPVNAYRSSIRTPAGLTGAGVTVALVDTGVADTGEVDVEHLNVSGAPTGDGLGHGTFLSGLVAGDGSGSDGAYQGVAPDAKVLDVQVADQKGSTSLSQVLAGLQAVSDRAATDPSVKVVSLALSTGSPLPPHLDPLTRGLRNLWSDGMTVVVASGNDGAGTVTSPAADPALLAVGATDDRKTQDRSDDVVADFSAFNRSFGVMRPDVVAPGTSLVSLKAPGSVADVENPSASVGEKYFKGTGTSMSSAVTAGAVAALVGARPTLKPNDVKRLLIGTAFESRMLRDKLGAGAGQVDVTEAAATDVSDTPKLRYNWDDSKFGPSEEDAATWAAFAAAWEAGDLKAVVEAWVALSPQTRRWAATAWSLAVLTGGLSADDADFVGRRWAGRRWATEDWNGRRWADADWVGRRWASIDWNGRRWATDTWLTADWEGRRWAASDWLAFAWTARVADDTITQMWSEDWQGRRWATDDWNGRRWADEDWEGRRWAGRRWAMSDWAGRRWASTAWEGRRWADFSWDGRRWAAGEWCGRRWAEMSWDGRRWAEESWDGRRWAVTGWGS